MNKVKASEAAERTWKSPSGKFGATVNEISVALGRQIDSLDLTKRHPFDVALVRLPVGGALCPYHSHSAQWEFYVVLSGIATVRDESGLHEVGPGEAFLFKPGEAHQILNRGEVELTYYVIADNPLGESCYYPDSDKWCVRKHPNDRQIMKGETVDYFLGEE